MYRSNGKNEMPKDNGYDPRTRDWYKIAKGAKATFSDPYKSSSSNAMMIAFSAPIGDKGVAAMNAGGMTSIPSSNSPSHLLFLMRTSRIDLIIAKRNVRLCVRSTYLS